MKKYLIVGLGNIGQEYTNTRHNIGFEILDSFADKANISFSNARFGSISEYKFKGRSFIFLKPNTYMNLSGSAVTHWLKSEKIPLTNLLIISDDLNLPFAKLRLKPSGSNGGHNGLRDIESSLNTSACNNLVKILSTSSPTYPASVKTVASTIANGTSNIFAILFAIKVFPVPV